MAERWLNLASMAPRTRANGPGLRAAVWVQGCTLRCPGCFNPHTHAHRAQDLHDPATLAARLLAPPGVEGLSILGGEPFQQAAACADLAAQAQALGRSVWVWSGYPWRHLETATDPAVQRLLTHTDVLCAGPYVERLRVEGAPWHGSANQRFVFLSDRDAPDALEAHPQVEVEVAGGAARWTGQSTPADRAFLARVLGTR